jgi:hypothetical protein
MLMAAHIVCSWTSLRAMPEFAVGGERAGIWLC